jgi:hypothetical protein
MNAILPRWPQEAVGSRPPRIAAPLAVGVGAAMLLVVATVSWLQVVARSPCWERSRSP